jgi:hypothetical protein
MARPLGVISCALILSLLFAKSGSGQQITSQLPNTSTGGQPGTIDSSTTIHSQNADEPALEISRQPGGQAPAHDEIVGPRAFKPTEDGASHGPDLRTEPERYTAGRRAPYLGITIAETSECVLGNEEHTLEVLSVRPGSPAAKAGLNANGGFSAPASIASSIFIPIGLAAHALLHRAGMPGYGNDLIIGVNDLRVHDKTELDRELSKLKPGDSAYINLIHPLPSGSHQTVRIFVTVGDWRTEAPLGSAGRSMGPAAFDSNGNVSYAY